MQVWRARYRFCGFMAAVLEFPYAVKYVRRLGIGEVPGEVTGFVPVEQEIRKEQPRQS